MAEQNETQHRKPRGRPWPKGTSGNPSGSRVNTRAVVLFAEMAADFGGVDALSGVDRAMLMQACRLMARGARAKAADDAVRLTSEARRILQSLRKPVPRKSGPSLSEYLVASGHAERAEALDADDVSADTDERISDAPATNVAPSESEET